MSLSGLDKSDGKRNVFTLWQEFHSQCQGQIQMNTVFVVNHKVRVRVTRILQWFVWSKITWNEMKKEDMFHNEQTDKELGKIRDIHINTLSNAIPVHY